MYSRAVGIGVLIAFVILTPPGGFADDRDEPVDILIALDKSLSMEQEIGAVKEYVDTHIIDEILQPGDSFVVIAFYGQNYIPVTLTISDESQKESIKAAIDSLSADGAFTDIGYALDRLRHEVREHNDPGRKKTLLLITDGIAEPPPESKYADPDDWRSHEYMRVTSETQKEGWKIIVLGVGTESAAEIAEDLDGQYVQTTEQPTAEEIAEAVPDLIGTIEVSSVSVSPIRQNGQFRLSFFLTTNDYAEPPEIVIENVEFTGSSPGGVGEVRLRGLLDEPVRAELPAEGTVELTLKLRTENPPPAGLYSGTFRLDFDSREEFDRTIAVDLRVNNFIQNFPWLIPVVVLVLIGAVVAIALATGARNRIRFRLVVEEKPLPSGRDEFRVSKGRTAFLRESMERFGVAETKNPKVIASLTFDEGKLGLVRIKEERFPDIAKDPKDVMGSRLLVRSEAGNDFHLRFESAT